MQLDATTKAAYDAATTASARAQVVITALADPVTVNVYNASDEVVGTGTMATPWATQSNGTITIGEVTAFEVTASGTPDADWYLRMESGAAYLEATFGLSGSGKEAIWSLNEWTDGMTGTIGTGTVTCVGNYAPTFTVAPTTASLGSSGGTVQFTATDANDDTLVYSLASRYLSSITINSSTGLVTVPSSAAGTSGNITVRASDGTLTTDATCAVTVAAGANFDYPRIAAGQIGGFGTTWDSGRWNTVAKYQIAVLGGSRWWSAGGYNSSGLATYLKSANPSIKLFKYTNPPETYYADSVWSVVWNKLGAEKGAGGVGDWWLRDASGNQIVGYSSSQRRVNFTSLVTPDANGWRWPQWFARFWYWSAGKLSGLTGQGIEDGPYDGVYQDNQYTDYAFDVSGDYDEDGVNESGESPEIVQLVVEGHVAYHDTFASIAPNLYFGANQSAYLHPTDATMYDELKVINDLGWQEDQSKMDYFFGWSTMMARHRAGKSWLVGPQFACLDAHLYRYTGWLGWAEERSNRYFLCSTLMDDGWYMPTSTDNGYSRAVWCDEFDHNLGQPVAGASGAIQTAAWSLGVYRREFNHGLVLLNPRGNGSRTVTLPSAGTGYEWRRLNTTSWASGTVFKNASVNTGASQGASLTMGDGTGLILRRVAT